MSEFLDELIGKQIVGRFRVNKIMWQSPDNDFKIVSLKADKITEGKTVYEDSHPKFKTMSAKGVLHSIEDGDMLNLVLEREKNQNEKYGKYQFKILSVNADVNLEDINEQKEYLRGVLTETQFENLYTTHENPYDILMNNDREALLRVDGFGHKTIERVMSKVLATKDNAGVYVKLSEFGLTKRAIDKLIETYKANTQILIEKIIKNPYFLIEEVDGYGFKRADTIAINMGIPPDSLFRVKAFIMSYLTQEENNGHSWSPPSELFGSMYEVLGLPHGDKETVDTITQAMRQLFSEGKIWYDDNRTQVAMAKTRLLERKIAEQLARLNKGNSEKFKCDNWMETIREIEEQQGYAYTFEQLNAIKTMINKNVVLISGKSGVGKSTIINAFVKVMERNGFKFSQCALSGRASARITEVTGKESSTIHRLLRFSEETSEIPPIVAGHGVILDEISMVDEVIFEKLVSAIPDDMKLIMLGDFAQLSSIGLGAIPRDIQESETLGFAELTKIHRQAQKSAIITEAHKIRNGEQIVKRNQEVHQVLGELQDLEIDIFNKTPEEKTKTMDKVIEQFKNRLDKVPNILELQVIVPMKSRGMICTNELNTRLQDIYNPRREFHGFGKKPEREYAILRLAGGVTQEVRVGDKVMVTKNNYKALTIEEKKRIDLVMKKHGEELKDKQINHSAVFNGDMGIVIDIKVSGIVVEIYRLGDIFISNEELDTVELAYAVTVFKSQGQSIHTVITALDNSNYVMLNKESVYTAITRTSKYCVLIAENSALHKAIETSEGKNKRTFLAEFLKEVIDS